MTSLTLSPFTPGTLPLTASVSASTSRFFDIASYAGADPTGAGYSDSALTSAIADAIVVGGTVYARPGSTFLISSRLIIAGTVTIDLYGSTLKKGPSMTTEAIVGTSGTVTLRNFTMDGNRSGGATGNGIRVTGGTVIATRVDARSTTGAAWFVNGASATMKLYTCSGSDNGTSANGNGLNVNTGLVYATDFTAEDNYGDHVVLASGASNGCVVRGWLRRGGAMGVNVQSQSPVLDVYVEDVRTYGVAFTTVNGCDNPRMTVKDVGRNIGGAFSTYDGGTAVGCFGSSRIRGGRVVSHNPRGYTLALARTTSSSGVGTTDCTFDVDADATDAWLTDSNTDPGVSITGGSQRNYVKARVKTHSYGVKIGEVGTGTEYVPYANNDNVVDIETDGCTYPSVSIDAGCRNSVRLRSRDSFTSAAAYPGLVDIATQFTSTTGSITSGTNTLTLAGGPYGVGVGVKITGALSGPADLTTVIDSLNGQVATLRDNATRTVSGAAVVQVALTGTAAATSASKTLTFASSSAADGFTKGMPIKVASAGAASADLYTTIDAVSGTTVTMHDAAGTSQASATVTQMFTMDNTIEWVDHASGPDATNKPKYVVNMDSNGVNNEVVGGRHRGDYQTAATNISGTGNSATLSS